MSWTVELPAPRGEHGRPALVMPRPGPWEIWAEPHPDRVDWHVRAQHRGRRIHRTLRAPLGDKHTVHVEARPGALRVTAPGGATAEVEHDACAEPFMVTFGSGAAADGPPVETVYREVVIEEVPYPSADSPLPDGPEDLRATDDGWCFMGQRGDARPSAPQRGRPGRAVRRFPAAGLERLPCRQGLGRIAGPAERAPVDRRRAHLEPHVDGGGGRARHQRHVRQPAEPGGRAAARLLRSSSGHAREGHGRAPLRRRRTQMERRRGDHASQRQPALGQQRQPAAAGGRPHPARHAGVHRRGALGRTACSPTTAAAPGTPARTCPIPGCPSASGWPRTSTSRASRSSPTAAC